MAFAFALLEARRQTDECPLLREENATGQRETLRGLLGNVEPASSVWRASD
jgi:ArsR family metal-binding transcriptional regulator